MLLPICYLVLCLAPSGLSNSAFSIYELVFNFENISSDLLELSSKEYSLNSSDLFKLLENFDSVNTQLLVIDGKFNPFMDNNFWGFLKSSKELYEIQEYCIFIENEYIKLNKYIGNQDKYKNSTLIEFSNSVLAPNDNSIMNLIKIIRSKISGNYFERLYKSIEQFEVMNDDKTTKSTMQLMHYILNHLFTIRLKALVIIQEAYFIKKTCGMGQFRQEIKDANENFYIEIGELLEKAKPFLFKASLSIQKGDPISHREKKTYLQITNFLHGYIINEQNLSPFDSCRDKCPDYKFTKTQLCNRNEWCEKETSCPNVIKCETIDHSIKVCRDDIGNSNRRYHHIDHKDGKFWGQNQNCRKRIYELESRKGWFFSCSYCFCICDEGPKFFSDRYINLRISQSNISDNRVVTGIRFIKRNKIIHLQVQESKLQNYGQIDVDKVQWVEPRQLIIVEDSNLASNEDYYRISWREREIDLSDVMVPKGTVVTGVKFKVVKSRIFLQVQATHFDFYSGKLDPNGTFNVNPTYLNLRRKFGKLLKLQNPDVPIRFTSPNSQITTNKFVRFIHSDIEKDAAQTTVPFFDAQSVTTKSALSGIGIYHKGQEGSGGFIAPRIFSYNISHEFDKLVGKIKTRPELQNKNDITL